MVMRRLAFGGTWLALAIVVWAVGTPSRAGADPLGEGAYAAWAAGHAARLVGAMPRPGDFTLGDRRDTAGRLGELVDEARAVEPPPRYAAAHTAYLAGMESVDQVRAALQTVVLTRQPVPGLADRLF